MFHFGGGYFDGSKAIARDVVDDDAEEVFAFGGSADLLLVVNPLGYVLFNLVEGAGGVEMGVGAVDEDTFRVEDKDGELEVGVDFAVGGAHKCDVGRVDGIADTVAAKGAVRLIGEDVAWGRRVLGLGWKSGRKDGDLDEYLGRSRRASHDGFA